MEEDYVRGDLSGIVVNVELDMVTVRFLDRSDYRGKTITARLVTRVDGSLAIDPSGLPHPHQSYEQRRPELPQPVSAEIINVELVRELPRGEE